MREMVVPLTAPEACDAGRFGPKSANQAMLARAGLPVPDGFCLDADAYRTDFALDGSSSYAFTLVLRRPDDELMQRVMVNLRRRGVEFRRGTAGGGNQLRQPYLRKRFGEEYSKYPNVDHVHFYGYYIGNFPSLEREKILALTGLLNAVPADREL